MKKTYLIIDTKLVAYYMFHRGQDILSSIGFLAELCVENLPKQRFGEIIPIFAMDKGKSRRVEIFKDYKAHRKNLIKKQGEAFIKKQKNLEREYQLLEGLFSIYGKTLNIKGLEADDIASIIASFAKVDNIVFATSDSDWVRFMVDERFSMLHINRQKLINFSDILEEFEVPSPYYKLVKDIFCGVRKENVSGLKKLGEKTFKKIVDKVGLDFDAIKVEVESLIDNNKLQLPDDVDSLDEMLDRNTILFTPMVVDDMRESEKDDFRKKWVLPSSRSLDDIINYTAENLGRVHLPNEFEKTLFKLS